MYGGAGRCRMPCGGGGLIDLVNWQRDDSIQVCRHSEDQVLIDWVYVYL